ncbi:MAG: glycosyltransferase family 2 protein [Rhodospirillales bacterium]
MKKISAVIPMYNASPTIGACVESIIATGYEPLEIIVVDDCSTDDSREIVKALGQTHPDTVKLLPLEVNGGPAKARNRGAEKADGHYLFFADSDTEILPGALHAFARHMEETGADALSGIYHWEPLNRGAAPLYKAMLNYFTCARHGVFDNEIFNAADCGIVKEVFHEVGGFNEELGWGMDYENEEMGQRIAASHVIKLDPDIQVRHHFDGAGKMTRLYFHRVSLWMEMFLKRRKFETNALGSAPSGLSTISSPLFLVFLAAALAWNPWFGVPAAVFLGLYLYWYLGFLLFVAGQRPLFLAQALILNFWFCAVLTAGAGYGVWRAISGSGRVIRPRRD